MKIEKQKNSIENGITLIALVITIIVLLILAGVSISLLTGDNGILTKATEAVDKTGIASAKEAFESALVEAEAQYYEEKTKGNTNLTLGEYITIKMIREGLGSSYQYCSAESSVENVDDDDKSLKDMLIYYKNNTCRIYLSKKGSENGQTIYKITFQINESGNISNIYCDEYDMVAESGESPYIGCYADIDNDGKIDGVIFADLAYSVQGTYTPDSSNSYSYSYEAINNLKEYYVSQESYTDTYFGTACVLSPISGSSGEDRFYVMSLSDTVNDSYYVFYWYKNAYEYHISDYSTLTSSDFGAGLSNTINMLNVWNLEKYGSKDLQDLWGLDEVGSSIENSVWFIPSLMEWRIFGAAFNIDTTNFSTSYNLKDSYWTSTSFTGYQSFHIYFKYGLFYTMSSINEWRYVRLATTF